MREIGGYLDFELRSKGDAYHKDAISLNLARNAILLLVQKRRYEKVYIPYFICDCVSSTLKKNNIKFDYYNIDYNFKPVFNKDLGCDEAILIVNYYGQLSVDDICEYKEKWDRIIVDNTHSFFFERIKNIDIVYNARKYFGIVDGAYLYTDEDICRDMEESYSYDNMKHLIGRFERTASEFYKEFVRLEDFFDGESVKSMSLLSQAVLSNIDYSEVKNVREKNYMVLNEELGKINRLKLKAVPETYMYPLMLEDGDILRKKLQNIHIYVPTLWPNVLLHGENMIEYDLAKNILPLPIDHRYTADDMKYMCEKIYMLLNEC